MPSCEAWKDSLLMLEIEAVRRNRHCYQSLHVSAQDYFRVDAGI